MRRYLQFGLKTILWLTVVVAVAVSWWRQRSLRAEMDATREQMRRLEEETELRNCVGRVCMAVDPRNPTHVAAARNLLDRWAYFWSGNVDRQRVNGYEVIVFYKRARFDSEIPPAQSCTAFLLNGDTMVDVLVEETRRTRAVRLEDCDQDGQTELVFHFERDGLWDRRKALTRAYKITAEGFREITGPLDDLPTIDEYTLRPFSSR